MKNIQNANEHQVPRAATGRHLAIILLITSFMIPMRSGVAQQPNLRERTVDLASELSGHSVDQLEIVNETWLTEQIYRGKVLDKENGEIYVISLDMSGNPVSDEKVDALVFAALERGFVGKLEASLKQSALANPAGSSQVVIWVKTPEVPRQKWQALTELGRREQVFRESGILHAQAKGPRFRFLAAHSVRVSDGSALTPTVIADIPNALLPELEKLPYVARVYAELIPESALSTSKFTVKATDVWQAGYDGAGVKVAIVESPFSNGAYDGSSISTANPYLGPVTFYNTSNTQAANHATWVAGVVSSGHPFFTGISFGVRGPDNLLSGNPDYQYHDGVLYDVNTATQWAAGQGAAVINQSYGINTTGYVSSLGIFDDYISYAYGSTVVACAGNYCSTNPCSYYVWDPAVGYNVIAVGNFSTSFTPDWSDDSMAPDSCYMNPVSPHGDREKPELAAPGLVGTTHATAVNGSWVPEYVGGTSFAAPHVTGTLALLMNRTPGLRYYMTDVLRAILLTSATHNIEGYARLSDRDGVGGLNAKAAYDVLNNGWADYRLMGYSRCLNSTDRPEFHVNAGQRVRAAISWFVRVDPGTGVYTFQDADLTVADPNGVNVWTSASFDNNYEIVDFIAPVTGTYRMTWCFKQGSQLPVPRVAYAYYVE